MDFINFAIYFGNFTLPNELFERINAHSNHVQYYYMVELSINKAEIAVLNAVQFDGEIILINNAEELDKALADLKEYRIVGIDTETKPSFKKGVTHKVSLLQLSTLRKCYLIRLLKTGITNSLIRFFEDENVIKIGLSLVDDIRRLHNSGDFTPRGFIDLQPFVKKYGIMDNALQRIYAIIFGQKISKSQRLSNWEAETLTESQKRYAATDAWSCLKIYEELVCGNFHPEESKYQIIPEPKNEEI